MTWKDVIYAIRPLWRLKFSDTLAYQTLYQYLLMVKDWRNSEAHISPTASEQEIDAAIHVVVTMYFFATGSCITDLESNGHDVVLPSRPVPLRSPALRQYALDDRHATETEACPADGLMRVAERAAVQKLEETTRLEILKNSLTKLLNYGYGRRNAVFSKLRHWEAIYRVAVDYGFVEEGDYSYFKSVIDDMEMPNLPYTLTPNFLANHHVGLYAKALKHWTCEGLEGKQLAEYEDIKRCADVFETIVKNDIREYKD